MNRFSLIKRAISLYHACMTLKQSMIVHCFKVRRGQTLTMRYGALRHEFLIGKPYGSRVTATAGYIYALRASPELWTRTLPHRTQILYTPDNALIAMLLDLKPGKAFILFTDFWIGRCKNVRVSLMIFD